MNNNKSAKGLEEEGSGRRIREVVQMVVGEPEPQKQSQDSE
jgi:hypothetical protein